MNVEQFLQRAYSQPGYATIYWPRAGGLDPATPLASDTVKPAVVWAGLDAARRLELKPFADAAGIDLNNREAERQACDCSGFVCWALGLSRRQATAASWTIGDGWINTDSIWADATGSQGMFIRLPIDHVPVGALLVHPKPPDKAYGHVGIVTEVSASGPATRVLHCSADNFKTTADAIGVTDSTPFDDPALHSVAAWYRGLGDAPGIAGG